MIFRQFFEKGSSTFTYLLADESTLEAILIDPVYDEVSRDLQFITELGLKLVYILNTHLHADHVTGSGALKRHLPLVKTAICKDAKAKADLLLTDGMILKFGKSEIKCISTPGHTNGCMSFYCENGGSGMVFTGDALLIRGMQID